jgi:predicted dehydrogenase
MGMLKYAIIGTGGMANEHVRNLKNIEGVTLTCACDIDEARVTDFAERHGIPSAFTDYESMLRKGDFAAISVVSPDSTHAELSLKAIAAGRHVLCEKPLATTAADALAMAQAARAAGVINMVNFSYRNSSAWQRAREMIANGDLGRIYHFQAHYLQSWLSTTDWGDWKTSPHWLWRLSKGHGSHGALGDVGVHLVDFATGPVGHPEKVFCHLKTFDKAPGNRMGDYLLDANDSALLTLECGNGAIGTLAITRWATGHRNSVALSIHGDRAALRMDLDKSYEMLEVCRVAPNGSTQPWETIYCGRTPNIYQRFVDSIRTGRQDQPDFARGAEVQQVLDACQDSAARGAMIALEAG